MIGCNQPAMMVRLNNKKTEVLIISLALEGKVSRTLTCVVGGGGWDGGGEEIFGCVLIVIKLLMLLLTL